MFVEYLMLKCSSQAISVVQIVHELHISGSSLCILCFEIILETNICSMKVKWVLHGLMLFPELRLWICFLRRTLLSVHKVLLAWQFVLPRLITWTCHCAGQHSLHGKPKVFHFILLLSLLKQHTCPNTWNYSTVSSSKISFFLITFAQVL